MLLDPPTLWLGLTVASIASTGALLGLQRYAPRVPGPTLWAGYSACLAVAYGSALFVLPDWRINSLLFNVPGAVSPIFLLAGAFGFTGRSTPRGAFVAMAALAVLAVAAFTYIWPNVALQVGVVSLMFSIGFPAAAVAIARSSADAARLPALVLAAAFSVLAVLALARAAEMHVHSMHAAFDANRLEGLDLIVFPAVAITTSLSAPFLVLLVAARLNAQLEAERLNTESSRNRIRQLAQRLETVRENERRSIANTLHEGVAQDLAAAKLTLSLGPRAQDDRVGGDAVGVIAQSIVKLRALTESLRPIAISHLALPEAVGVYARAVADKIGLSVGVSHPMSPVSVDESIRLIFFRAAQEALMNVVHHAQATRVDISFGVVRGCLVMTVADDGIGISASDLQKPHSLGLFSIRERLDAIGGEVGVAAGQPRGTVITVIGPKALA